MQIFATVLRNVCFRLYADIVGTRAPGKINSRHHLQHLFERRIRQGRCFHTPCLGWSEFTCDYWGPFRQSVMEVDTARDEEIPSLLTTIWSKPVDGGYEPAFRQRARITRGVLFYSSAATQLASCEAEDA